MSNEIRVVENQSVFDLAIEKCGTIEAVFAIAELNDLSITDALTPGQILLIPPSTSSGNGYNKPVTDYYKTRGLKPATDITNPSTGSGSGLEDLFDDGIDYMAVGVDNVVT